MRILNVTKIDLTTGEETQQVPFRNSLLQTIYPKIRVAILKTDPEQQQAMIDALGQTIQGMKLDFATGAKKRAEFIATDQAVSRRFWDTPEEAAAYGSNLLTDCCEPPTTLAIRVLVVEDGEFGTGDCHAKVSPALAYQLGHMDRAAQFRLVHGRVLAKGTFLPDLSVPRDVDMVLPLSAVKSSTKPAPGCHTWTNTTIGIHSWSERRGTKSSYSILQWFSREALEADVIPHVNATIDQLLEAGRSPTAAAELLRLVDSDDDEDEPTLLRIVADDPHGQLTHHPWVVSGLTRMLRRRWMHTALGGGLNMTGLMGVPDDALPEGTISTREMPAGPVIATRYPLRSWADVRMWQNDPRHAPEEQGIVAMSHDSAALLGGDFDGDYFSFLPADEFPKLTEEIREWHATRTPPEVVKVKERSTSNWDQLPQVMLHNADNMVGHLALDIARACAQGRLDLVDALAPELQVAVDKFKYNLEHDHQLIEETEAQIEPVAWLDDRRSREAFVERPIHVDEDATDTISWLARQVAAAWEPTKMRSAPLQSFAGLFPDTKAHQEPARELARRYGRLVASAIHDGNPNGFTPIFNTLRDWAESRQAPKRWAAAIWSAVHRPRQRGTGSLAFHAFPDQVIEHLQEHQLESPEITIVGTKYHEWAQDELEKLQGRPAQVAILRTEYNGEIRQFARVDERTLGLVSAETPISNGTYTMALAPRGATIQARAT